MSDLNKATILLTGGTGSFGKAFISFLLSQKNFKGTIRIFSRDEFKQYQLQQQYPDNPQLRFFIGDIRDRLRLKRAMRGTDIVIHSAALKQITTAEYNPFEVIKTNIMGSQNIVETALDNRVQKAILISSDKAVYPISLYGATKLAAERIFIQGNVYGGPRQTIFSVARFGNILGSRGSVVPLFFDQKRSNTITLTHPNMTRFWITPRQTAKFTRDIIGKMKGTEIFVPKLPSIKIVDLIKAIAPKAKIKNIGVRPSEKIYEELIAAEEFIKHLEFPTYFILLPYPSNTQRKNSQEFTSYRSDRNSRFLTITQIRKIIGNQQKNPL